MQEIFLQNPALPPPKIGITEGKEGGREVLSYSEHSLDQLGPKIGPLEAKSARALSLLLETRAENTFLNLANMDL